MISKELFIKTIDKIQVQRKRVDDFSAAISAMSDGYAIFDSDNGYLSALLDVLHSIFDDEGDYIGWWLYEDVEKIISWEENGEQVSVNVTDAGALYDFLILNMKERRN